MNAKIRISIALAIIAAIGVVALGLFRPGMPQGESERKEEPPRSAKSGGGRRDGGGPSGLSGREREVRRVLVGSAEEVSRWLGADPAERARRLNELSSELRKRIEERGDYGPVAVVLSACTEQETYGLLRGWVVGVRSVMGLDHDLAGQGSLIEGVTGPRGQMLNTQVLEGAGERELQELERSEVLRDLEPSDFAVLCRSAAGVSMERGIAVVELREDPEARNAGVVAVVREALNSNSLRAGEFIGRMQDGPLKDEAVTTMIGWMADKGSGEEARPWLGVLSEGAARERAENLLGR